MFPYIIRLRLYEAYLHFHHSGRTAFQVRQAYLIPYVQGVVFCNVVFSLLARLYSLVCGSAGQSAKHAIWRSCYFGVR